MVEFGGVWGGGEAGEGGGIWRGRMFYFMDNPIYRSPSFSTISAERQSQVRSLPIRAPTNAETAGN